MSPVTSRSRRAVLTSAAVLLTLAGLGACASDTADEAGTEPSVSASAEICTDVAAARESLEALVGTDVLEEGTDTLRARLATFESDVRALLAAGQAELAPEVESVETSLADLGDVVAGLQQEPTAAAVAQLKPAVQEVRTSTEELIAEVSETC
jgi:hypothetical protein